jgi:hypothetical protein
MSPAETVPPLDDRDAQGVRLYVFLCTVSAAVMALVLVARNLGSGALLPAGVGVVMALVRLRSGALLLLLSLVWVGLADRLGHSPLELGVLVLTAALSLLTHVPLPRMPANPWSHLTTPRPGLDVLLCAAVLLYVGSYYRLLSVTRYILPIDRRRRVAAPGAGKKGRPSFGAVLEQKRSPALVEGREIGRLLMAVSVGVVVAELLMSWLRGRHARNDLRWLVPLDTSLPLADSLWQVLVLLWLFAVMLMVVHAVIGYLGLRRLSPEEAALYLQDQLWRQTRREQARLNRWLAWAEKKEAKRRSRQREATRQETHT